MCALSNTDNEAPTLEMPKSDKADPKRTKLRKDNEAPICSQSRTATDAPKRAMPKTDIAEPMRAKHLKDIEAPK
jgi:hypothetical protein